MQLKKRQKEHLLELISDGLETDEINARAALFRPPYQVSRQQVDHYRKTRKVSVKAIQDAGEQSALKTGFARREERVRALDQLAQSLYTDLTEGKGLWLNDVKMIGSGEFSERIEFEAFNGNELTQFRGVLDDIAKEMGDRRHKVDVKVDANKALAELLGVSPDELPNTDNA
jgi:hypothetical protein